MRVPFAASFQPLRGWRTPPSGSRLSDGAGRRRAAVRSSKSSARRRSYWSHRNSTLGQVALGVADGEIAKVEDTRCQSGVGLAFRKHVVHVLELACATTGNNRHADRFGDHARQPELVAVARAVGVNTVDDQLARAELDAFARPVDGLHAGAVATPVRHDLV